MFYNNKIIPKASQTLFMLSRDNKTNKPFIKELFITKASLSKIQITQVGLLVSPGGYDKDSGQWIHSQSLLKEMKNHIIIKTRCGEHIDYSTLERVQPNHKSDDMIVDILSSRKKAKAQFLKLAFHNYHLMDECAFFFKRDNDLKTSK